MAQLPLESHNPVDVAIDEAGRAAQGSVQWLLESGVDKDARPTTGNSLQFFVCGEEGFQAIAGDLMNAQSTVDICCWGFDPGMELWRGPKAPAGVGVPKIDGKPAVSKPAAGVWPRGVVYGALLEELTQRAVNPVTVRLLLWYDDDGSKVQNSMPGFTDVPAPWWHPIQREGLQQKPPYANSTRTQWCIDWWKRNLPDGEVGAGKNPRLQIVLRSISKDDVQALLTAEPKEEDAPSTHTEGVKDRLAGASEKNLLEDYPTHHQKPILIDYAHPDDGRQSVGYVMGLNSITDYWDRTAHEIDDPLREQWDQSYVDTEHEHEQATENPDGPLSTAPYRRTFPYQDYACQLKGKALKRLHQNFERGWNLFAPAKWKTTELPDLPSGIPNWAADPAYQVQIVRTQPHEHEKTIKKVYLQASSFARNYIYMENQYFFYPEFARHLKAERKKFYDAWSRLANKPQPEAPVLHLFIVTPHPQDDGMIPRTYDTMAELGHADAIKGQRDLVKNKKTYEIYRDGEGKNTFNPQSAAQLRDTLGLKVSIARLRTSGMVGNQMAYREIYIHSKLMIIDDVFLTLGSANMNQRSMSVDSEINIATTGPDWASGLRGRVFPLLSGGATQGGGDRDTVAVAYDDWEKRMHENLVAKMKGSPMQGFILPFEDSRAKTVLHAQIEVPSTTNTIPETA